ncbi:MAG: hypothetical protein LKI25_07125 [Atopobiaceae bacterium]|jgi:hypothetical protein|nr:hypothetical protein [Atopobiaceae bacterium]MCI2173959.1 hypothetical protein [Atopobiaceae bacterium]MCI2207951.1 hypothetical protein [Atopobiaceae bacterium]
MGHHGRNSGEQGTGRRAEYVREADKRFERTDVPRGGRHANVIAIVVLLVVAALIGCLIWFLWQRAQSDSSLGDVSLSNSLEATTTTAPVGTTASTDSFTNVLVLTVDDVSASSPTLEAVHILVLDTTAEKGCLATLPASTLVTATQGSSAGDVMPLDRLLSQDGYAACVGPVSTVSAVPLSHAVVIDSSSWEELWSLVEQGSSTSTLISKASGLFSGMRSDMSATDFVDLFKQVQSVGRANLTTYEDQGTEADGGLTVDTQAFGLGVGTLVTEG